MEFQINNSPELSMSEITKQLFNNKLLSDIKFSIEDQIMYAHSLELMKRIVVFQQELEPKLGEQKVIPITDCTYECFFQFIQFIYRDYCDFGEHAISLLKLSLKYKVIKLEIQIIPFLCKRGPSENLSLFEFCVMNGYELPRNRIRNLVGLHLDDCLESERFKSLQRPVVEEILKLDRISKQTTELQIFNALTGWINHQCEQTGIELDQRRETFENLTRLIRFPAMKPQEVFECIANNRELFAETDFSLLFKQFAFKTDCQPWNSQPRKPFSCMLIKRAFPKEETFKTEIAVSEDIILSGINYGLDLQQDRHEIKISSKTPNTKCEYESVTCKIERKVHLNLLTKHILFYAKSINFGDSIVLKANTEYTIEFKYYGRGPCEMFCLVVVCRQDGNDIIINDPSNSVKLIEASPNLLELLFKPVTLTKDTDPMDEVKSSREEVDLSTEEPEFDEKEVTPESSPPDQ